MLVKELLLILISEKELVLYDLNSKEFLWYFLASNNLHLVMGHNRKKRKIEIKRIRRRVLTKQTSIEFHQAVTQMNRGRLYNGFAMKVNKV